MKQAFLSLLYVFLASFSYGQNWNCFVPGTKQYFTNSYGYLRGMRIDSVRTVGSDTVYYPFHTIRGFSSHHPIVRPLDTNGGSWLGKNAMQLSDGIFLIDNEWGDTVVIKTQTDVGDSWIFYSDSSTLYYLATVVSKDTMNILGSIDSVKKINIQAYNGSSIVTDSANGFQIILSKHNGFAQVFDLYTFPYHFAEGSYSDTLDYFLTITGGPGYYPSRSNQIFKVIPLLNPTWNQMYDWNTGDIVEYKACPDINGLVGWTFGLGPFCAERVYYIDTIVSRHILSTSVNCYFKGKMSRAPIQFSGTSYDYLSPKGFFDTGENIYYNSFFLDTSKMPEENNLFELYFYYPDDSSFCIKSPLYTLQRSSLSAYGAEYPFLPVRKYKTGLGLVSYAAVNDNGDYGIEVDTSLIYYKRGRIECGGYVDLVVPGTSQTGSETHIYPNPANDELTIRYDNNSRFEVSVQNMIGQSVLISKGVKECRIDVSHLPDGIYMIRVNDGENYFNQKLVVRH